MNNPTLMRCLQAFRYLAKQGQCLGGGEGAPGNAGCQRVSFNQLHDKKVSILVFFEIV